VSLAPADLLVRVIAALACARPLCQYNLRHLSD
jgi:hypothetical protein